MTEHREGPPPAPRSRTRPLVAVASLASGVLVALWLRGSPIVPTFGDVIASLVWIGAAVALGIFAYDEHRALRTEREIEAFRFGREALVGEEGPESVRIVPPPPYDQDRDDE